MNRRHFSSILGALGLLPIRSILAEGGSAGKRPSSPEQLHLTRNGWMPNNDRLPVLLYRSAFRISSGKDAAAFFEQIFTKNGWPPQWRNGVYDFHHYHSTAHEVLGFVAGHAQLMLGGENGLEISVEAGDVAVLPTGTGHCKISASPDFLVVGAYPPDQSWDICRAAPSAIAVDRMSRLPFPNSDPVEGARGPLIHLWRSV
ncbi:Cupin domain-containing protein [Acidisarcina polymorpha]|uniref:Cupin domain-containing protein n=1 Tax=Acidisarcina polymorpha TaxID=2211140 RepID=A0A2Z5FS42_9BACT|nr:cupin [Acidisarcina polymorpha]AXC09560.1 Cupin domain-containing protein [Acidisarcina polymorpha]